MSLMNKNRQLNNLFPVNLILKDKKCVIIGGGKVATNKIKKFISAGVIPTVISSHMSDAIIDYSKQGVVKLAKRKFEDSDIENAFMVFIATDDQSLNCRINKLCQEKNILCCAVDDDWHNSNFITPASFKEEGITVSISTGGKSCRLSRLLKEQIKKSIYSSKTSGLLLIGTDHRYLPLKKREKLHLHLHNHYVPEMISKISGLQEFMILNTCNRIELLCLAETDPIIEKLIVNVLEFDTLSENKFYLKRGLDAFKHLSLVTSGIYSQLIGENHITAQLKDALANSEGKNYSGGVLKSCIEAALFNSKEIRNAIHPIIKPSEIDALAIKYIKSLKEVDLTKDPVAVLGTGKIGSNLIEHLLKSQTKNIYWFYNKNIPGIDKQKPITLCPLDNLEKEISKFRIIISALRTDRPLLKNINLKANEPIVIDLGMPRNISPDFAQDIVDLDKLKIWFRKEACSIKKLLPHCDRIINKNIQSYEKIFNSLKIQA